MNENTKVRKAVLIRQAEGVDINFANWELGDQVYLTESGIAAVNFFDNVTEENKGILSSVLFMLTISEDCIITMNFTKEGMGEYHRVKRECSEMLGVKYEAPVGGDFQNLFGKESP